MPDFDLHLWFSEDEIEACPRCGEREAINFPTGALVCFACGFIQPKSDSEAAPDEQADA